ncbi:MAG TPA: hypothetical protein VEU96_33360 [Bryobacteraceae bacterium]|nr:hypothetical protein [Bryobacteraceae bacterium]
MPQKAVDLWPEIDVANTRTPVSILKQQAALLGKHTNNLLEATVETIASSDSFVHRFIIEVPALAGYRYELFSIRHDEKLYPVQIQHGPRTAMPSAYSAWQDGIESEEILLEWLKAVLNSPDTKRLLGNLLAQVES